MIDPAIKKEICNLSKFKQYQYLLCAKLFLETGDVAKSVHNFSPQVQSILSRTKFTDPSTFISEIENIIKKS